MQLGELTAYLDRYLNVPGIRDVSNNGLQVQGERDLHTVAFAVDACVEAIERAGAAGAQMLVVHHGLFWGEPVMLVGPHFRRVRALMEAGISLYAVHLPLDIHPEVGNNVQLARALGLEIQGTYGDHEGTPVGVDARLKSPSSRDQFVSRVDRTLGAASTVWPFGNDIVRRVAIVSGSAASLIGPVAGGGFDVYLTGETTHTRYHDAREYGLNVVFGGHYATETWGLKALATHLDEAFGLHTTFINIPTGL